MFLLNGFNLQRPIHWSITKLYRCYVEGEWIIEQDYCSSIGFCTILTSCNKFLNSFLFNLSLMKIGLLLDQRMGLSSKSFTVWKSYFNLCFISSPFQLHICSLFSLVGILPNRVIQPIAEHSEYPVECLGNVCSLPLLSTFNAVVSVWGFRLNFFTTSSVDFISQLLCCAEVIFGSISWWFQPD